MPARFRKAALPYLLLLPGLGWLLLFFAIPLVIMALESLKTGTIDTGFQLTWEFSNYSDALSDYDEQFLRSFEYAGLATLLALAIGYPLAYVIAFRGGKWRNALLLAVILPFFVTYLIRTLSWETILDDESWVVDTLKAGVLLTFIPAAGDFVNATLLGTPRQAMIGNVIQSRFQVIADYPSAAALSFILMALILVLVLAWARFAGTES